MKRTPIVLIVLMSFFAVGLVASSHRVIRDWMTIVFTAPLYAGAGSSHIQENIRLAMQALLSFGLFLSALYIILSKKYPTAVMHWAYGAIGTLIGFWFKG